MNRVKSAAIALAITALAATLTGCTATNDAANPQDGFWITTNIGDVWCIDTAIAGTAYSCQWDSLTRRGSHQDARQVGGELRYVTAADGSERHIYCLDFRIKGRQIRDCNWDNSNTSASN